MTAVTLQEAAVEACSALLEAADVRSLVQDWRHRASMLLAQSGFQPVEDGSGDERADHEQGHLLAAWQDLRDPVSGRELRVYAQLITSNRLNELGAFEAYLDLHTSNERGETDVLVASQLLKSAPLPAEVCASTLSQDLVAHLNASVLATFTGPANVFERFRADVDEALSP